MKVSVILALVAAATVVSAETNAGRFARGLGPMAPIKRGSKSSSANKHSPSKTPGNSCSTQNQRCCNQTGKTSNGENNSIDQLLASYGISVPPGTGVGVQCVGVGGVGCSQATTCCTGPTQDGLINLGCNSINL